jgi:hypothetical protein
VGALRRARTYRRDETRDCLTARAQGNRALIVLVRVTPHQGTWEGHVQGEAAQGEGLDRERARDVRILNQNKPASGEPRDTETVLRGSGRGGGKRPVSGTSPAAYFISGRRSAHSTQPLSVTAETRGRGTG